MLQFEHTSEAFIDSRILPQAIRLPAQLSNFCQEGDICIFALTYHRSAN